MKLHPNTRKKVEEILSRIKEKLDSGSQLAHHGVEGQKWVSETDRHTQSRKQLKNPAKVLLLKIHS